MSNNPYQPRDGDIMPNEDSNAPIEEYTDYVAEENLQPDQQSDDALLNSGYLQEPKARTTFKENWEKVDELCPSCGNVTKKAEGLTRQNVKKLFSFQTDVQSLTILFLFLMCCAFAFTTYTFMTSTCNDTNATIIPTQEFQGSGMPLASDLNYNINSSLIVNGEDRTNDTIDLQNISIAPVATSSGGGSS